MKRAISCFLLVACALALVLAYATTGETQSRTANLQNQRRNAVEARLAPGIAVGLNSALAITSNDQTVLRYSVTNQTGRRLTTFGVLALILDKDGRVKGGEGWIVNDSLEANSAEEYLRAMSVRAEAEDRLTLTVWRVGGDAGMFELDRMELNDILSSRFGDVRRISKARSVNAAPQSNEYCNGWYTMASQRCPYGVKSFSCSPNGAFSWTCFTAQENPPPNSDGPSDPLE